jgi:hypothetical protein
MVMREQHPLDALYANRAKVVEHTAIAEVDEQRSVTVAKDIDVAGVGPPVQVRIPVAAFGCEESAA